MHKDSCLSTGYSHHDEIHLEGIMFNIQAAALLHQTAGLVLLTCHTGQETLLDLPAVI